MINLKKWQNFPLRLSKEEKGVSFITVLIILLMGSVIIASLLSIVSTGAKVGIVYDENSKELYSANAGIDDGIWQIKYNHLSSSFTGYSPYEYEDSYDYTLPEQVNDMDVDVGIKNIWVPVISPVPAASEAATIVNNAQLIVTGSNISETDYNYKIKIQYYPQSGETLNVDSIGIWLPPGFTYQYGSCVLEEDDSQPYYVDPASDTAYVPHCGNQAIIWNFDSLPFYQLPDVYSGDFPMVAEIKFKYIAGGSGGTPLVMSWITTNGVSAIPYAWDADVRVFSISAAAGDIEIETYVSKSELRQLSSAISGDYIAVGNSLMVDTNHDYYDIKDSLLADSDASVEDIPDDAQVAAAYLYWSAWRAEGATTSVFSDTCNNFGDWINGGDWSISSNRFRSHYNNGSRLLTLHLQGPVKDLDLSSYQTGLITVSWDQSESGTLEPDDGLDFALSGDGGTTWSGDIQAFRDDNPSSSFSYTIPVQYRTDHFKIRFRIASCSGSNEYVYIDNISVNVSTPDTNVNFSINGDQVYLDVDGEPQQGTGSLISDKTQVLPNYNSDGTPNGFSYYCYKDVTALVQEYSDLGDGTNRTGNADYTVGGVTGSTGNQWSYAGWSLIVIYTSPETVGHQLYLYDKFMYAHNESNIDFDEDGQPGGSIRGFIVPDQIAGEENAARLTVFVGDGDSVYNGDYLQFNGTNLYNSVSPYNNVWNSRSSDVSAQEGIDIDTFNITWASNLLEQGDTYAEIDMPTDIDSWNLIYIIISFRSETTTGGALSFLIRS
jgi:hypothetical protein